VTLTCNFGHRVEAAPSAIGAECWVCGGVLHVPDDVDRRIRASVEARA